MELHRKVWDALNTDLGNKRVPFDPTHGLPEEIRRSALDFIRAYMSQTQMTEVPTFVLHKDVIDIETDAALDTAAASLIEEYLTAHPEMRRTRVISVEQYQAAPHVPDELTTRFEPVSPETPVVQIEETPSSVLLLRRLRLHPEAFCGVLRSRRMVWSFALPLGRVFQLPAERTVFDIVRRTVPVGVETSALAVEALYQMKTARCFTARIGR